ncbi:hypothetical protein [Pseudoduganella armeniaca]|uniref:hypothetical protein n=1 Tax=Pseudoduganella armeniaca TaxID=2072590 RepID=UPI001E4BD572|nr:hypothetical protein [Pseudoduganella armeniaca]
MVALFTQGGRDAGRRLADNDGRRFVAWPREVLPRRRRFQMQHVPARQADAQPCAAIGNDAPTLRAVGRQGTQIADRRRMGGHGGQGQDSCKTCFHRTIRKHCGFDSLTLETKNESVNKKKSKFIFDGNLSFDSTKCCAANFPYRGKTVTNLPAHSAKRAGNVKESVIYLSFCFLN